MHLPQRQSHLLLKLINYKHPWGKTSTAIAVWVQHLFFSSGERLSDIGEQIISWGESSF